VKNVPKTNFSSVSLSMTPTLDRRTWSFTATYFNRQIQQFTLLKLLQKQTVLMKAPISTKWSDLNISAAAAAATSSLLAM